MSEVVRIKIVVHTGFAACKHEDIWEVDKEWWDSLTVAQQERALDDYAAEFRNNVIDVSVWVMEEGEDD